MIPKKWLYGILLSIFGACCWGISGNVGQYLSTTKGIQLEWLVTARLLGGGIILFFYLLLKDKSQIFQIWKNKQDIRELLIFSILGMLPVQYTYFVAIKYSNAATATVLQYTGPVMILLYLAWKQKKIPTKIELFSVFFALLGTFLIATNGNLHNLALSPLAILWGELAALSMAFYTIQPQRLLDKWASPYIISWSMIIGGLILSIKHPLYPISGIFNMETILGLMFILVFGTVAAFSCYLLGVKYIGATMASLFVSVEPLTAAIVSIFWLNETFTYIDLIGFVCIISTVFLLSFQSFCLTKLQNSKSNPSESELINKA